jgi:predicted DNA-binding transcriptional regulator AlpA
MSADIKISDSIAPLFYDVKSLAVVLGCSTRHVWRLRDSGKLPAPVQLGGLQKWARSTIDQWIAAGCPAVAPVKKTAKAGR